MSNPVPELKLIQIGDDAGSLLLVFRPIAADEIPPDAIVGRYWQSEPMRPRAADLLRAPSNTTPTTNWSIQAAHSAGCCGTSPSSRASTVTRLSHERIP